MASPTNVETSAAGFASASSATGAAMCGVASGSERADEWAELAAETGEVGEAPVVDTTVGEMASMPRSPSPGAVLAEDDTRRCISSLSNATRQSLNQLIEDGHASHHEAGPSYPSGAHGCTGR